MLKPTQLRFITVELSSRCQADCPLCVRNDYGYKVREDFPLTEISLLQYKKIFDTADLPLLREIHFNGNFGDPLLAKDIIEIIDYSFTKWPHITLSFSTNGGMRSTEWWSNFGTRYKDKNLYGVFCIDGLEDTNHIYRINVPYEKVFSNARAFINAGGSAHWKMIKFKHNQHQFDIAEQRSKDYGFKKFIKIDKGRNQQFVFTNETDGYWIEPADTSTTWMKPWKPEKFQPYKNESNPISDEVLAAWVAAGKPINCESLAKKDIFIAANGEMYPCCYLGKFPKTFKKVHNNIFEAFGNISNNAIEYGLENSMKYFNLIEESWQKDSVEEGALSQCIFCCSGKVVPQNLFRS